MVLKLVVNNQIRLLDWTNVARINIEDSIFKDNRFLDLVLKLGDKDRAIGCLVMAWVIAQEYWKKGKLPIPAEVFKKQRLNEALIKVGLATECEDGSVYICGSEEQFSWLINKQKAGKIGGLSKKVSTAKQNEANGSKPKHPEASYSSSSSCSRSSSSSSRENTPTLGIADGPIEASASQSDAGVVLSSIVEKVDCHSSDSERESSSGRNHPTSLSPGSSEASSCEQPPQSTPPIGRRPPIGSQARKSLQVDSEAELVPRPQSGQNIVATGELTALWNESAKGVTPKVRSEVDRAQFGHNSSKGHFDSHTQDYLSQLYQAYPRKLGKAAGIKKLESLMKGKTADEKKKLASEILRGIERYSESVRGEESKYTLYFSTFINQERWKDYQVDEINKSGVNEVNAEPLFGLPGLNDD